MIQGMEEDTDKRGKQKTHPVWNFLDFVRQGIKEAVYKCKLCGLEKEGISASRWTPHILGRAVGNATTAGIDSCSGGGEDKSKLKQVQQALNDYQRKADNKKDEKKKHDSALLDRENDELKHAYIWMAAQSMRANEWWEMFGSHLQALQKLAMRVLTAPVSTSAGERNWSAYKHIISDTRTRLTSEHAVQLVYVYWNSSVLSKTMNSDKPQEAFEWDKDSIAWMNETFNWENQGDDEEDVACDEAGNTRVVVTLCD